MKWVWPHVTNWGSAHYRNIAAKCDDMALQNQVIMAAKQTALATQGLIACTKVLAPCINSPLCQEQLIEACKLVAAAVEKIVLAAQVWGGGETMAFLIRVHHLGCMQGWRRPARSGSCSYSCDDGAQRTHPADQGRSAYGTRAVRRGV